MVSKKASFLLTQTALICVVTSKLGNQPSKVLETEALHV